MYFCVIRAPPPPAYGGAGGVGDSQIHKKIEAFVGGKGR